MIYLTLPKVQPDRVFYKLVSSKTIFYLPHLRLSISGLHENALQLIEVRDDLGIDHIQSLLLLY